MTVAGVTVSARNPPGEDVPQPWVSFGVSMGATITVQTFGHTQKDITLHWGAMAKATKDSLRNACIAIGPGNTISVTPDTGDDLEVGASGATNFTYLGFKAVYLKGGFYAVDVYLRKYA